LHVFGEGGLLLGPFMCDIDLHGVLFLFAQAVVVPADVPQFHPALLLGFAALVKLVAFFVLFLVVLRNGVAVDGMFGLQFVRQLLRGFFLIRLFWFFTESPHVLLRLFVLLILLLILCRLSFWWGLSIGRGRWDGFLPRFSGFFFVLFLFGLVFGRDGIEHS
jgi:hypothetical protein